MPDEEGSAGITPAGGCDDDAGDALQRVPPDVAAQHLLPLLSQTDWRTLAQVNRYWNAEASSRLASAQLPLCQEALDELLLRLGDPGHGRSSPLRARYPSLERLSVVVGGALALAGLTPLASRTGRSQLLSLLLGPTTPGVTALDVLDSSPCASPAAAHGLDERIEREDEPDDGQDEVSSAWDECAAVLAKRLLNVTSVRFACARWATPRTAPHAHNTQPTCIPVAAWSRLVAEAHEAHGMMPPRAGTVEGLMPMLGVPPQAQPAAAGERRRAYAPRRGPPARPAAAREGPESRQH